MFWALLRPNGLIFSTVLKRFWPGHSKDVFVLVLAHLEPKLEPFEVWEIMVQQIIITIIANVINFNLQAGESWMWQTWNNQHSTAIPVAYRVFNWHWSSKHSRAPEAILHVLLSVNNQSTKADKIIIICPYYSYSICLLQTKVANKLRDKNPIPSINM